MIGLQVLEGLAAVHAAGVLHRDVKPGNVLFGPDGGAVLADFGVATLEDDAAVTSTGLVLGSPAYLAPERARGEAPTAAADLWSLGATLFAAVEGRSPFHREGPLPTLGALLTQDVPAAPAAGPLAPAIAALLTKDPAARPDADAVRGLLLAALTPSAPAAEPTSRMLDRLAHRSDGRTADPRHPADTGELTTSQTAAATVPAAGHEAWEVPARPVPLPRGFPSRQCPPPGRAGARRGTAAAPSVPFPRRRALVALAVVALLSGPVVALAQRPGSSLAELPAAAGGTARVRDDAEGRHRHGAPDRRRRRPFRRPAPRRRSSKRNPGGRAAARSGLQRRPRGDGSAPPTTQVGRRCPGARRGGAAGSGTTTRATSTRRRTTRRPRRRRASRPRSTRPRAAGRPASTATSTGAAASTAAEPLGVGLPQRPARRRDTS